MTVAILDPYSRWMLIYILILLVLLGLFWFGPL
jgi:hypothetical protein